MYISFPPSIQTHRLPLSNCALGRSVGVWGMKGGGNASNYLFFKTTSLRYMLIFVVQIRDAPQIKKRENVGIFPKWGTPPPPPCLGMTRLFEEKNHGLFCILGGVSHVKNSKKWKWDSGRPPPPVFSKLPHFPIFLGGERP